ncbi:MAG: PASTA domain-containing protein [Bacteroidetes bacterium]|nr:PASTA domain-containing protein [Bacteroidota bacterium]HET6244006.1 PASTA domain-containing protein [Bacteroidia bacterium]
MNFFRFLISKIFFINLFAALFLLATLSWVVLQFLSSYTLHGETITVPELRGYQAEELDQILNQKGFRYIIVDSVYDSKSKPGIVIDQEPKADLQVKEQRMLYLTINTKTPPKVKMPDLIDFSLRQAIAIIESAGLVVGNLKYIPDIAHNAVLSQEFKGMKIEPGKEIFRGSSIDLVLGKGVSDEMVLLPNLLNLTYAEAIEALFASSLNLGSVIKDETVKDSTQARVYKQIPQFSSESMINMGSPVDIFITQSPEK